MTAPRDELFSTSAEDRKRVRRKRITLGCCGLILATVGVLGLYALWLYNT
jgi:hypothetical protein